MNPKKLLLVLFGVATLGLLALGVLSAIFIPRFVERAVIDTAKQRGIVLQPGNVSFGWGFLQLSNARATLSGVKGLSLDIAAVDVELDRLEPKSFTLNGVKLSAVGEPLDLLNRLSAWRKAHGPRFIEPASIRKCSLTLRRDAQSPVLLALDGGALDLTSGRGRLTASTVKLYGVELGAMRLSETASGVDLALTLALSSIENPLLSLQAREEPARTVHLALGPTTIGQINSKFATKFPLQDVKVSGTADVLLPPNVLFTASGRTDVVLQGYVPPHPVELDGFLFGDTTTIGTRFRLEPEALRIRLEGLELKAGRFHLKGGGHLGWEVDHARLVLSLSGQLPCSELTAAVAESRLGRALGHLGGKAARQVLAGSVGIHVAVDADSREPERARALKTITPGCGLRALTLAELIALGELVPEAIDPRVLSDFEKLLERPMTLPDLGKDTKVVLPDFPMLPFPGLPRMPAAKTGKNVSATPTGTSAAPGSSSTGASSAPSN